ncbi:MAG: ABC transporter ATP-binding protein [Planctomycetota bacterium]
MSTFTLHDLTLARGKGSFVLGPIDLRLEAGARTALVGPSGSGKTTLLRLLAGLERPDRGRIALDDETWSDGPRLVLPPAARRVGFVFQDGALWPHMTALEHLRFVDPRATRADAEALLNRVGLAGFGKRRPDTFSGGERQRLALARALAGHPQVLLLDEPLHSVDVHLRDELSLLIRGVAIERGLGLVVVTHDRRDAFALATEIVVLHGGRVIEAGAATTLASAPRTAFTAAFLGAATCIPVIATHNGHVESPFGSLPVQGQKEGLVLALLPDDVRVVARDRAPTHGRILRVMPDGGELLASIQLGEHVVLARCPRADAPALRDGAEIGLALAGPPRLLSNRAATTHNESAANGDEHA